MITAAIVCLGLNEGLDAVAKLPRPTFARGLVRGMMCNSVAGLLPIGGIGGGIAGGIIGKAVYETTIGVDGILTNLVNGTFKCQPGDKRDRCAIWVQQNPVKTKLKKKKFSNTRR